MRYNITAIFVCIDEFCKAFEEWEKHRLIDTGRRRYKSCEMSCSFVPIIAELVWRIDRDLYC